MSELTFNVLDGQRAIHGRWHGGCVDRVVASLGADPETIEELQLACGRFTLPAKEHDWSWFRSGVCDEPWDAGIVYLDLAARLIVWESTYSTFLREGVEWWDGRDGQLEHELPFRLAGDWEFSSDPNQFAFLSKQRRASRQAIERIDERAVLFGRVHEFIVRQIHAQQADFRRADDDKRNELIRDIHARWLLMPRDDLRGRSPRETMVDARKHHVTMDVQWQQHHWSLLRRPPPAIPRDSAAYKFGGFGTHEIIMYYDFVREMLHESANRFEGKTVREDDLPAEAEHLQRHGQDWLHAPYPEFHGRTPASIIDRERQRMPEAAQGDEAIVDPDCPCCQAMADEEQFGPMFWGLDGCNMDDGFAFDMHSRTREDWEAEQEKWRKFNEEFDRKQRERQASGDYSGDYTGDFTGDEVPF